MTISEAISQLENMANAIQLIPSSSSGQAMQMAINALKREQQFLDAGYKNARVEFNIGGRSFMVKEMAQ